MRRTVTFALAVALFSSSVPQASAGCAGDHYEYDHGECVDRTEETTSTLLHAFYAGDGLQQGMIDRARSDFRESYGRRPNARQLTSPDVRLSFVSEDGPDIAPSILARRGNPHDRARQREAERFNEHLLTLYRRDAKRVGMPSSAIAAARWYFIQAAYGN